MSDRRVVDEPAAGGNPAMHSASRSSVLGVEPGERTGATKGLASLRLVWREYAVNAAAAYW